MPRPVTHLSLILVLIAAASYFWNPSSNTPMDLTGHSQHKALAKTYLTNTRSWAYDAKGALAEILEADRASFYSRKQISELSMPHFYSHQGNDRTWSAVSDRGTLYHRAEVLKLDGNVTLSNDQSGAQLETQKMKIYLDTRIAISIAPVLATQGLSSSTADGMVADLGKETITMAPNVESIYVQPKP